MILHPTIPHHSHRNSAQYYTIGKMVWDSTTTFDAPKKRITCSFWRDGDKCSNTAATCQFAHFDTSEYPPLTNGKGPSVEKTRPDTRNQSTCAYWRDNDRCSKNAEDCDYAHFDTGTHAPLPGNQKAHHVQETSSSSTAAMLTAWRIRDPVCIPLILS